MTSTQDQGRAGGYIAAGGILAYLSGSIALQRVITRRLRWGLSVEGVIGVLKALWLVLAIFAAWAEIHRYQTEPKVSGGVGIAIAVGVLVGAIYAIAVLITTWLVWGIGNWLFEQYFMAVHGKAKLAAAVPRRAVTLAEAQQNVFNYES
jgi:hypothetical protein